MTSEEDRVINGGFLSVEDNPPSSPVRMKQADSKERVFSKSKNSSTRTKSPSFLKMLVGRGLRKVSNHEAEDTDKRGGDTGSFSDNDEPISFSAIPESQRKRINHIATLPRRSRSNSGGQQKSSPSRVPSHQDDFNQSLSPEESACRTNDVFDDKSNKSGDDFIDYDDPMGEYQQAQLQTTPSTGQAEYTSVGLEALEMLHNQLQILVIQDGDSDMADVMHENVEESLRKQIHDLQESLTQLQKTEQNLRLSLKMAEMRAKEAETKLHHSSQRGLKMEEKFFRLEKDYNSLYHHYSTLEKHLQKQAVLQQMQQTSPNRKSDRRPNSANNTHHRHNKSFDSSYSSNQFNPVKRHNSSEFLTHHQRQKTNKTKMSDCSYATADINPCNTLPTRLHSGSLSHTETRV